MIRNGGTGAHTSVSQDKRHTVHEGAGKSRAADMEQGLHKIKFVTSRLS